MLATCGCHALPKLPIHRPDRAAGDGRIIRCCTSKERRGSGAARHQAAARAGLSSFVSSRIDLDSQTFQTHDLSRLLWVGPIPGDIAEVEAYCRIFRAAEQLHSVIMRTLCNPETGECPVSYEVPSEDMRFLEEKVVAVLGCMIVLINKGRKEVLSGRSSFINSFKISNASMPDGRLPPLAIFRGEVKKCCESLHVALANYLSTSDDRGADIWRRLQRLKNVCYDAGFPRGVSDPCPMVFANWSPVYFSTMTSGTMPEDSEVAFWRGGQVTDEGLTWLIDKGYKTIVDLREESVKDECYHSAIEEAISCGHIEVVRLPVEAGTTPSMEQVEKFASLLSDPMKRPLYLHCQEGVKRTYAMVSRWRQYIARSGMRVVPNYQINLDRNSLHKRGDNLDLQNFTSPKSGSAPLGEKNDAQCNASATDTLGGIFDEQGLPAIQNAKSNGTVSRNDAELKSLLKFSMESDPFHVQLPKCDVFSKKEMTQFFKGKNISPKAYLNSRHRRRFGRLPISTEVQKSQFQISGTVLGARLSEGVQSGNSNEISTVGEFFLKNNGASVSNESNNDSEISVSLGGSLNGTSDGKSYSVTAGPKNSRNVINNFSQQVQPNPIGDNKRDDVKVSFDTVVENPDFIEGNMCASTTGVVRVQSRKKAEMFLVRTDGFSCTREKVTESSLAFTHPSTQQQMLMWKSPPKTVLLLKKLGHALMEEAKEVASFLYYQEKMNVLVEPDVHDLFARIPGFGFVQTFYIQDTSDLHERVDLVACLGGDGVILHASNLFRGAVPPVVSFNLGSLGFLTSHTFEEYNRDLRAVIHGNNTMDGVYITLRMRLRCEIFRKGKAMPGKIFDVLNEVVVDRGSNPYLSKIECYEHDHLITKVQGDGVIVATPTGSTAYSTAAGGSMVHPNVPCMLFTPICPHSLSFRPVILPDSAQLELKIPNDTRSNAWVSFDGKRRQQLSRGDSVRICMSQHPLPTVNKSEQTSDWFRSLIRCLNWNERLDQKAL